MYRFIHNIRNHTGRMLKSIFKASVFVVLCVTGILIWEGFYGFKHLHVINSFPGQGGIYATSQQTAEKSPVSVPWSCAVNNKTSEILSMVPITFLPNFKNPCWYEPLPEGNVYENNFSYRRFLDPKIWFERQQKPNGRRLRCLPYFFVAGQPKCGTTDIYYNVQVHPDIVTLGSKGYHWWSRMQDARQKWNQYAPRVEQLTTLHNYVDLFDQAALVIEKTVDDDGYHKKIAADASPSTLWFNDLWWVFGENCGLTAPRYTTAHYVNHLLPDTKIIVSLREPAERAYSDYLYWIQGKKTVDGFHRLVLATISNFQDCLESSTLRSCIYNGSLIEKTQLRLQIGIYYFFLEEWFGLFPREQFHFSTLEDYKKDRLSVLKQMWKFLGLRPLTPEEEKTAVGEEIKKARNKNHNPMREDTRRILREFYQPYNEKLAVLLNDPKYRWSTP